MQRILSNFAFSNSRAFSPARYRAKLIGHTSGAIGSIRCFAMSMQCKTLVPQFSKLGQRVENFLWTFGVRYTNIDVVAPICMQHMIIHRLNILYVYLVFPLFFFFVLYCSDGICDRLILFLPFSGGMIAAWSKRTTTSSKSVLKPISNLFGKVVGFLEKFATHILVSTCVGHELSLMPVGTFGSA